MMANTEAIGQKARTASRRLADTSTAQRNDALLRVGEALGEAAEKLLEANSLDVARAREEGIPSALVDRLVLKRSGIDALSRSFAAVACLPDPLGEVLEETRRPNGLQISKVSVPIGVLLVIYESRPNVTAEVAALTLKSGNAVILRGGKEALETNRALTAVIARALSGSALPLDAVQFIDTPDRTFLHALLSLEKYIDLVMPRGGENLIRFVAESSRIPVIKHYKGVCHLYIDKDADLEVAESISINAKCQRPGVCNAIETLLVHSDIASLALPRICGSLMAHGVEIRGDAPVRTLVRDAKPASEEDWSAEYLDLILSVKVVRNIDEAIAHINTYGSHHSDAIITSSGSAIDTFLASVDSACVYSNASTRFTDGGEFGMGAEIGISTDKLHARGPMGLRELTTYKYLIRGSGQVRS